MAGSPFSAFFFRPLEFFHQLSDPLLRLKVGARGIGGSKILLFGPMGSRLRREPLGVIVPPIQRRGLPGLDPPHVPFSEGCVDARGEQSCG